MGSSRHSTTSLSSASTEEDVPPIKWGPNLKRTRKVPTFAGPWNCQLCNGSPIMTSGGMRKHYKSHYKLWDSSTNILVDMNEAERAHFEHMKELRALLPRVPSASATGAQPIKLASNWTQFLGPRTEPSAARGYLRLNTIPDRRVPQQNLSQKNRSHRNPPSGFPLNPGG